MVVKYCGFTHVLHAIVFLQIQCILQDVGSHIATPRGVATESKLGLATLILSMLYIANLLLKYSF